jgi:Protein of unknown function (DUF3710)
VAFGRKKSKDDEPVAEVVEDEPAPAPEPVAKTTGPYDADDLPDGDETARLDLGGLRVAVPADTEIRVDVNEQGQVMSAVAVHRGSQIQLNAFAAPRREGIWADVRAEIAESLRGEPGGAADEVDGPFGKELRARIPTGQPGQFMPARFVGADGPRWFVRGLITGPAATDPAQASTMEAVFRGTVVIRGNEAMAPRDALPLHLPKEAAEAAAREAAAARGEDPGKYSSGDMNPFERGPEITETR